MIEDDTLIFLAISVGNSPGFSTTYTVTGLDTIYGGASSESDGDGGSTGTVAAALSSLSASSSCLASACFFFWYSSPKSYRHNDIGCRVAVDRIDGPSSYEIHANLL
jgi:hypothetical protein